jgi:predicted transporter
VLPVMIVLVLAGIAIFVSAPLLGKLIMRGRRDPVALIRILQLVGIILLVAALLIRPYNRETTAVPPPPDAPEGTR